MSIAVAVPFGVASAVVYGASIVVQHQVAQQEADECGASAAGLVRLIKHPMFLLAIAGDFIGFLLQIVALATGPVVIVQPLVVLMLPVSLGVNFLMGGHRPRFGDYLGVVGVLGGLAAFLVLIGHPGNGHIRHTRYVGIAIILVLVIGTLLCLAVTGRNKTIRGAMYGAVAGACFGTLAVLIDAVSGRVADRGLESLFDSPGGLVPIAGMALCGAGGMILTQMSFQVGALGATLPANLAVDPLTAVLLGAVLLREHIPHSPVHLVAYACCVGAVLAGAIQLAAPKDEPKGEPVGAARDDADQAASAATAASTSSDPRRHSETT